jgi:hypothetical protein
MNQKYLFSLITISLVAGAGIFSWNYFMPAYANNHAWFILLYYFLFTMGLHYYLTKKTSQDKSFIMKFMGVTGIKLFLNLIVILVYGLNNKPKAVTFALIFMIVYFIFTIFESRQLIKAFPTKKENKV